MGKTPGSTFSSPLRRASRALFGEFPEGHVVAFSSLAAIQPNIARETRNCFITGENRFYLKINAYKQTTKMNSEYRIVASSKK